MLQCLDIGVLKAALLSCELGSRLTTRIYDTGTSILHTRVTHPVLIKLTCMTICASFVHVVVEEFQASNLRVDQQSSLPRHFQAQSC